MHILTSKSGNQSFCSSQHFKKRNDLARLYDIFNPELIV